MTTRHLAYYYIVKSVLSSRRASTARSEILGTGTFFRARFFHFVSNLRLLTCLQIQAHEWFGRANEIDEIRPFLMARRELK
jgi:hypothetical protein